MARQRKKGASKRKRVEGVEVRSPTLGVEERAFFEQMMRGEPGVEQAVEEGQVPAAAEVAPRDEEVKTPPPRPPKKDKAAGDGFFSPFAGLKEDWAELREQVARAEEEAEAERRQQREAREAREAAAAAEKVGPDELEAFQRAVAGVVPLPETSAIGAERRRPRGRPFRDDEAEVMAELADLVSGRSVFDSVFSDEHVEGVAEGIDRRLLKKLRKGAFSVGNHIDLHGLTRVEARPKVEAFLAESRRRHHRCVLIVHGRGLHSKEGIPVLKEAVGSWLMRGGIARSVLAFCSARPADGGLGAIYVLLRR